MFVKRRVEMHGFVTSSYDQIIRSWFNKLHNLKCMWLDLTCIKDVPHKVLLREHDDGPWDPVVVD